MASIYGQKPTIELTFTAVDNAFHIKLDSIKVMNRNQGGDTVLYSPDTVLVLDYQSGIPEVSIDKTYLKVFQNHPNPFEDQTTITLYVPEKDKVDIMITDMLGRQVFNTGYILDKGYHSFRFSPGIGNLFFFNALWKGHSSIIKVLHLASDSHKAGSLEYIGSDNSLPQVKLKEVVQSFSFTFGDELLIIGYSNTLQSGMLDTPAKSETFILQFATNIPCPGTPTVTYEGQVYNTIQILGQCWLKENLNVGSMINSNQNMQNNGVLEKYCYNDEEDSCTKYGGLYKWDEMMQYTTTQGVRGICPPGWHLPTDEEWKVLEGSVDSQYGIGNPEWDLEYFRGIDAGLNLKFISGWQRGGNGTDLVGFSGLPGGIRQNDSLFSGIGHYGFWWASTDYNNDEAWHRRLRFNNPGVSRYYSDLYHKGYSFSVRCLRDN